MYVHVTVITVSKGWTFAPTMIPDRGSPDTGGCFVLRISLQEVGTEWNSRLWTGDHGWIFFQLQSH